MMNNNLRGGRCFWRLVASIVLSLAPLLSAAEDGEREASWRTLPLVAGAKIDPNWRHLWGGGFAVMNDGSLRTDCSDAGMGLLLYAHEQFGDCQIRVVYRTQDAKSNAGVYVRIDDGVLNRAGDPLPLRERDAKGKLTKESLKRIEESSNSEREAWYPVHHGYEVQICDAGDEFHRTGAIYSLAPAAALPEKPPGQWRTMIITLQGNSILVDVDGKRLTTFDPDDPINPPRKQWSEPKRESKRPRSGFIGLQNHDPGDVVYFKEVAVRPLGSSQTSPAATKLRVGVVQLTREPQLGATRDKIAAFIRQAKDRGCRLVVFPEGALCWPPGTSKSEIDAAIADLQKTVQAADVYAVVPGLYVRYDGDKPFNHLVVIDPQGRIIHTYDKLWSDNRFNNAPGLFEVDGAPCAATICADRWIRSVEELPAAAGAKVLLECSNNFDNEWIPDLGWYWYVPRAVRNGVYVVFCNSPRDRYEGERDPRLADVPGWPGHGHSAVIAPDGRFLAAAGEESDKLLVTELDLSRAIGAEGEKRRSHPLFQSFWETGVALLDGQTSPAPGHQSLVSPQISLKIAAAQMACSQSIEENLAKMTETIRRAAAERADVVVFPELALTGARDAEILAATQAELDKAVAVIKQAAKEANIYVVFGMPRQENGVRQNCAVAIGPSGDVLTRYAQLAVDRPELFASGTSTRAMWFEIKGVPSVVTVGGDALWSEIAEMAAWRGAQVHLHLDYDTDASNEGQLRRKQLWVNLASFRTFTATVNAASPQALPNPSAPAGGGSAIWEDYHRGASGRTGGYAPHSAVRLAEADQGETILYATQQVPKTNRQYQILTEKTNPQMIPWYAAGAKAIHAEAPAAP